MVAIPGALPRVQTPETVEEDASTRGIWSWITTVDHKRIGLMYGVTAFVWFIIGGLEAMLIRVQLAVPQNTVISAQFYNELFTMHGTTMIFLAVMPLTAAFFNYMVPLMIGARDVAFPRLNAFSYWVFLFGGILLNASFFLGGAPDAGWFGYANLTSTSFSQGPGIDFWAIGLQVLGVASIAASLNFIVTIINMRAPGMSMMRMPIFVWMTLITNFLIVFAFPIITVALILLTFDRHFGTNFYVPAAGGDPVLWQHLFWMFGHPEVYILILPAFGIISEVLPVFSRKPLFGSSFVIYSGIAIAVLGFSVWAHHMFAVGLGPVADSTFAVATMLIAIPTGVKIFNWIGTMAMGTLRFRTPMLFACAFIVQFIIGGLSGVMHASPPADLQQTDTYFVVAHFHYVLFGGALFGIFAGIYYWFPKFTGRMLKERLGIIHLVFMVIGFNLTFFPQHFLGLNGMPRRIYTYLPGQGWELWNLISTIGAFILAFSIIVFIINVINSLRNGEIAGNDPWDAATLEWSIPSPPPVYNFARIPTVHSPRPLWDAKYPYADEHRPTPLDVARGGPAVRDGTASREAEEAEAGGVAVAVAAEPAPQAAPKIYESREDNPGNIHMPSPSFWPVLASLGLFTFGAGVVGGGHDLAWWWASVAGAGLLAISIVGWTFEPPAPEDHHEAGAH